MIVLDENISVVQWEPLRRWRIHFSHIGWDLSHAGLPDDRIIPLLRTLRRPTFVSRDRDFFDRALCNNAYCLVYLDTWPTDVAEYIRRLLRHPQFKTWAQRRGCVLRLAPNGIACWRAHAKRVARYRWRN